LAFKENSVKQQRTILFEISLERRDKFNDRNRNTDKEGRLIKTLLTYLNFILSECEVVRYFEQVNYISRKILIFSILETCSLCALLDSTSYSDQL
jgi:hypothetical protein